MAGIFIEREHLCAIQIPSDSYYKHLFHSVMLLWVIMQGCYGKHTKEILDAVLVLPTRKQSWNSDKRAKKKNNSTTHKKISKHCVVKQRKKGGIIYWKKVFNLEVLTILSESYIKLTRSRYDDLRCSTVSTVEWLDAINQFCGRLEGGFIFKKGKADFMTSWQPSDAGLCRHYNVVQLHLVLTLRCRSVVVNLPLGSV